MVVVVKVVWAERVVLIHAQVQVTGLYRRLISTRSNRRISRKRTSMHAAHSSARSGVRLLIVVAVVVVELQRHHLQQVDHNRSLATMHRCR